MPRDVLGTADCSSERRQPFTQASEIFKVGVYVAILPTTRVLELLPQVLQQASRLPLKRFLQRLPKVLWLICGFDLVEAQVGGRCANSLIDSDPIRGPALLGLEPTNITSALVALCDRGVCEVLVSTSRRDRPLDAIAIVR